MNKEKISSNRVVKKIVSKGQLEIQAQTKQMELTCILFLFTLLFNDISCKTALKVITSGYEIIEGSEMIVYSGKNVEMLIEADDQSTTSVLLEILYFPKDRKGPIKETQTVQTGIPFYIPRQFLAVIVAIILKAMDQTSYYMETSYVQINFVSFPLRLIITPEEEAAVAKQLAITGKIDEITQN